MLTEDKVTEIFDMSDKFCKFFYLMSKKYAIEAHGSEFPFAFKLATDKQHQADC